MQSDDDARGIFQAMLADGRPPLKLSSLLLVLSGVFALFLSVTRHFLPHDVAYLGMTSDDLCRIAQCRIVHFMFHDRVSFGGVLVGIGAVYLWLVEFPLRAGRGWAWWLLVISATEGFASFLTYLGYGYLDTWHGAATLALIPLFAIGLYRSRAVLKTNQDRDLRSLFKPALPVTWNSRSGIGRICFLACAIGLFCAGATIMTVGMTSVFVPTDLQYMGLAVEDLRAVNPRLIPLIAHDRAGFGGGVCCLGILLFFSIWCSKLPRSLWQVLCIIGVVGFGFAIGVHPTIGYDSFIHLFPAIFGAVVYAIGLILTFRTAFDSASPAHTSLISIAA